MKLVVRVKLLPTPVQAAALEATLTACNEAASWASTVAFEKSAWKNLALRPTRIRTSKPGGAWARRPRST